MDCPLGPVKPKKSCSNFVLYWTRWSLYHTEWKSKIIAKSLCTVWQSNSAHAAWVKRLTQAAWAELDCQTVQSDLAIILDFHSVWYRDHLVQYRTKLEQLFFGLTGPNGQSIRRLYKALKRHCFWRLLRFLWPSKGFWLLVKNRLLVRSH